MIQGQVLQLNLTMSWFGSLVFVWEKAQLGNEFFSFGGKGGGRVCLLLADNQDGVLFLFFRSALN